MRLVLLNTAARSRERSPRPRGMPVLAALLLIQVACVGASPAEAAANADRIRPWPENPWYWQYHGKPVLLLGGSRDDNPFQLPDLEEHLKDLAEAGGNYLRNTMSDRPDRGFEVYAYKRLADGRYDLDQWNPEYWERFSRLLHITRELGIIVQIEVWDRFDYSGDNWEKHPCNPKNNVNYTYAESGFTEHYREHAGANKQPFFFTTPKQRNNTLILQHQQRFVSELLRHALPFPNVLYCIDNETSGEEAWAIYWAEFIQQRADEAGVDVYLTEMWDDWNLQGEQHRRTFDHPERFAFVDVSQNNHQKGQTHWDRFQWARTHLASHPRPINTVKTYGADSGRYGTDRDGVERWWRHLIGGAAAVRFHRPDSGLGLSPAAIASIRAARKLESVTPLWNLRPDDNLMRSRAENEAYLAANPGSAYALFFPDGGSIELDLRPAPDQLELRWINIRTGEWGSRAVVTGGDWVRVSAPGPGPWAATLATSAAP